MPKLVVCGAINWDMSCFVDRLPRPGEEVTVRRVSRVSGGTGGNVAVAAARVLGPGEVSLVGALGQDTIASRQIEALSSDGVATDAIERLPDQESGQAYIMIDSQGQNIIASHLGANGHLSRDHILSARVTSLLEASEGLVMTDPPIEVASSLVDRAQQNEIPVYWDPGILIAHGWAGLASLAAQSDSLFLNETETAALFGTEDPVGRPEDLLGKQLPSNVILKLGSRGARVLRVADGIIIEVQAFPLHELGFTLASTVGCGDAFVGVFAAYRVLGASLRDALEMATVAAGLNAARDETRGSPGRTSLEAALGRAHGLGYRATERPFPEEG
ncbi:MAG: carbohydrate kinase family protein [Chloroflexota bacterium]